MARMIQIRNVPEALHRRLQAKAAIADMSLSDFLREELVRTADQLSDGELRTRLAMLPRRRVRERVAAAVRQERSARR